jgi:putative membrane protein
MSALFHALFGGWYAEPVPLIAAAGAVLVYDRGARRLAASGSHLAPSATQKVCLVVGVGVILVALLSPLDDAALRFQWVHMVQHVLLLLLAPPLIVIARPWETGAAALGLRLRRLLSLPQRALSTHGRQVGGAIMAVVLFVGVLWAWHIPFLYNLTLRDEAVHNLEHTLFLAVGLLFWTAALPRRADAPSLGMIGRSVVVLGGLVGSWMLAVYIGYAPAALYAYPGGGGLSAVSDQQLASGVMWVPASVPFLIAMIVLVARWFEADARAAAAEARWQARA